MPKQSKRNEVKKKSPSKKPKLSGFNSVKEYLASLESEPDGHSKAKTLRSIIDLILAEFPELESKIAWNVPIIHRNGKNVFGVAAFKNHLTLAPWSPQVMEDFKQRLGKLVVMANCFQIPVDWKVDEKLVKDLVEARLAELD